MKINIIVAVNKKNVIGNNGKIPWKIPSKDLERFKKLTTGFPIIMGRKTWESIPKKNRPLFNRYNIIVSSFMLKDGLDQVYIARTFIDALKEAQKQNDIECWIIGGEKIYQQALLYANTIYLTEIKNDLDGDTFFHIPNNWKEITCETYTECNFLKYERTDEPYKVERK